MDKYSGPAVLTPQIIIGMPFLVQRVDYLAHFIEPYTYKIDLGSSLLFDVGTFGARLQENLNKVGNIAKGHWVWHLGEDEVFSKSMLMDFCYRLYMNFASADDAMLIRMTFADIVKVEHVNGRRVSRKAEADM
jgi:hypothetical protein